jgi:NAD-dependent SIR2 family protein deacetylase
MRKHVHRAAAHFDGFRLAMAVAPGGLFAGQAHGRRHQVIKPVLKPTITFFGESLPRTFHDNVGKDCDDCDLVVVIGSSLKVSPVAQIPDRVSEPP